MSDTTAVDWLQDNRSSVIVTVTTVDYVVQDIGDTSGQAPEEDTGDRYVQAALQEQASPDTPSTGGILDLSNKPPSPIRPIIICGHERHSCNAHGKPVRHPPPSPLTHPHLLTPTRKSAAHPATPATPPPPPPPASSAAKTPPPAPPPRSTPPPAPSTWSNAPPPSAAAAAPPPSPARPPAAWSSTATGAAPRRRRAASSPRSATRGSPGGSPRGRWRMCWRGSSRDRRRRWRSMGRFG